MARPVGASRVPAPPPRAPTRGPTGTPRPRGRARAGDRRAVGCERFFALVRLVRAVRERRLVIVAHWRAGQLVKDEAAGADAVPPSPGRHRGYRLPALLGDALPERFLHVLLLVVLVVR